MLERKSSITSGFCAPNLRVHPESLRLADLASPAFFAEISKFLQRNFFAGEAANLTKDDAMCYDFGMWIAERIAQDNRGWLTSTAMRQSLNDNFALTPARTGVNTVKSMVSVGTRKLQRVTQGVEVAALPEARRIFSKDRPKGVKLIMTYLLDLAQKTHREGGTYREWTLIGKRTLEFFARGQNLETMEMIHLLGWTWSPVILAKVYQLDPEVSGALPGILARLTLAEIMALFVAVGPEEFAAGPIRILELLVGETADINVFLTFRAVCSDHYPALRELMRLCSKRESKREVDAAIHAKEDALNQWVFSTMIHMSGIFEGGARTPAGFFFPSVLATMMNLEVPELLLCVGETLVPIFGGVMVYRYPDFPVVLAAKAGRTNLLTAIQDEAEVPLSQRFTRQVPVMAFCALKNPDQTAYNYDQMIGARADRSRTLGKEVGTVEWSHGASDPKNGRALFVPWKVQEMIDLIKEYEDRVRRNVRRGQRFTHYKMTAPTDLTQQTLKTMTTEAWHDRQSGGVLSIWITDRERRTIIPVVARESTDPHPEIDESGSLAKDRIAQS